MKRVFSQLSDFWGRLADRPLLISLVLFMAGVVAAALPTMRTEVIVPQEYDEFAYLLGADTFLHGRLANPPHPLAPFFETMHVLQQPTYASKYPPGQSLQLAAGSLLGHPIFGVWITVGLLGVAAAWMLRGLAPATWAVVGGLVAAWQWGALTYWGRTYWGGSLFALAGMLVFGGAVRFLRKPNPAAAWWAAVGAGMMMLTRPYEGLWFCVVPAFAMLWTWICWKPEGEKSATKLRAMAVAMVPLGAALAFLLIYNHAVTGSAWKFPHRLYQEQSSPDVSVFTWETPGPAPKDRNPELTYQFRRFNPEVMLSPTVSFVEVWRVHLINALPRLGGFFFQGLLGIGAAWAILGGSAWREQSGRLALASVASFLVMLGTLRFFGFPHYAAAWSAPLAVIILIGFRALCAVHWRGWHLPPALLGLVLVGWVVATLAIQTARGDFPYPWVIDRLELTQKLEQASETDHRGHVVFVMLAEGQPAFAEWVYNTADIDRQPVIFARSLGAARDVAVARYYPTRHLWQAWLKSSGELDHLTPYDPAALPTPPARKG